jgi:capsular polysaccharide export protein
MQSAAAYVIESFAANAPKDVHLVLKSHPLDPSFFSWSKFVRRIARRRGVEGRLHFVDGGDLDEMLAAARGLICVNSTSATLALARGIPVCTVGAAIYDIAGLTHQEHLDSFWEKPTPPEPGVYDAFRRVLVDRCLIRGGLASESAVQELVRSMLERLRIPPFRLASSTEPQSSSKGSQSDVAGTTLPQPPNSEASEELWRSQAR